MALDPASSATPATASLAPGFRFHPTDQELVGYYLKRKVVGKPFRFDAISEVDIYKSEPWDLPGKSKLKSRDLEWYFFSALDKKYGNGWRTNRATEKGYWKTTGKDRPVVHKSRTIGMKKTLVFHCGRAPKGERSNWVMHEYKLVDEDSEKNVIFQDALVLCRVFQKSGTGPKNGEQYGAPFVEEEWEDDKLVMIPGEEAAEEAVGGDDDYLDGDDLEQILNADIPSEDVPVPLSFYYEDNSSLVQELVDFNNDDRKALVDVGEGYCAPEQPDGQNLFDLPVQNYLYVNPVRHEYIGEPEPSNTVNSEDADLPDYLLDDPFLDATDNTAFEDQAFLETNDLSNAVKLESSGFDMLDDYLTFFDPDEDNSQYVDENLVSDQASLTQKYVKEEAQQETMGSQQGHKNDVASTSKQEPENFGSDIQYPFIKKASRMLESISAPPAFASEYPSKDATLRLNSTSHSSSSIHVTAGIIQIRNITPSGNGTYWSVGKNAEVNIIISFGLSHGDASLEPPKSGSATSWGLFYLLFVWVLILSMSFKFGTCIYTGKAL